MGCQLMLKLGAVGGVEVKKMEPVSGSAGYEIVLNCEVNLSAIRIIETRCCGRIALLASCCWKLAFVNRVPGFST